MVVCLEALIVLSLVSESHGGLLCIEDAKVVIEVVHHASEYSNCFQITGGL
jgi:hypothetical protein